MLEPIVLTSYGEILLPHPEMKDREEEESFMLHGCIGTHQWCDGKIDVIMISQTHNTLYCHQCGLRVPIPDRVKTWEDLRECLRISSCIKEVRERAWRA